MWEKIRLRQRLPVERMLGTALVQAFLGIKALLSHKDLAEQAERASVAPWQMPNNRPFTWYVSVFKVLIGSISREGWFHRAHLWNLIFLQHVDGSFEMSSHLARVLKAGPPLEDLLLKPVSTHDVRVLHASIPRALREIYCSAELDGALRELWSTILVLAQLKEYPYTWTENPNDPEVEQITLRGRSEMFIAAQCRQHSNLEWIMPDLRMEASLLVIQWTVRALPPFASRQWPSLSWDGARQRLEAVGCLDDVGHLPALVKGKEREGQGGMEEFKERMRYVVEHLQARNAAEKLSFWELGNPENAPRVRAKLRQFSRRVKRNLRWAAKAHPLTAIYLVGATEPFSRSERILTQASPRLHRSAALGTAGGPHMSAYPSLPGQAGGRAACARLPQPVHHPSLRMSATSSQFLLTSALQTNTYILMLTVTVWFYYSKSVTCCKSLRSHLECPNASDVREPCLGFGFCAALGTSGGMLPEELQAHEFVCTAFPDGTYTGAPRPPMRSPTVYSSHTATPPKGRSRNCRA
ncbi:hypothetical protein CYMTET_28397, partial [Cymbomonas tetramitiformis]